ncbi:MAG: transglycosylase SLT domain-containing protein [Bacteroidales bacterium]|nr:transglycosylase SLT domain-containing protein [Bacteroidales bacterium]
MKKLSIIAIILSALAIAGQIFIFATQKENPDDVWAKAQQADYKVYVPLIPDSLTLAGEKVPLDLYYVRESLDRELVSIMFGHSNTILYMKRAGRYFPVIEPILKKNGVPEDFKYLCVIESGLTNATSPAKAQGFWQFMKGTASEFGLEVNDDIDMRNNLEAATEAACRYLKGAHSRLGSWSAAAASYNCGENGFSSRREKQMVTSYYDTRLNSETSRYVFRILAMKLIMQNPQNYGFMLRKCDLYAPIPTKEVELRGQNVDLYRFAKQNGTNYKVLRDLNPWLVNDKVTNKSNKSYTVKIPIENGTKMRVIQKRRDTSLVTSL